MGISRRVHDQSATVESMDRSADWSASSGVPRDSAFRDASMSCSALAAVSRTLSVDATRVLCVAVYVCGSHTYEYTEVRMCWHALGDGTTEGDGKEG